MKILKYKPKASTPKVLTALLATAVVVLTALFSAGCNQDGVGIYYAISQEEKQISSKISELRVKQVVEANSGKVYALTGNTVWEQSGSNWNDIGRGYGIVSDGSNELYVFNYDFDSTSGTVKSWDTTAWTTGIYTTNADADLFNIDNAYVLEIGGGGTNTEIRTTDTTFSPNPAEGFTDDVFDGTQLTDHYLISEDNIYKGTLGFLDDVAVVEGTSIAFSGQAKSGTFRSITNDGSNLFLVTSSGQVYSGTDGTDWTYIDSTGDEAVQGSTAIVNIDGTDYLLIGTDDGYYEMEIGSGSVTKPNLTIDTVTSDSFAATYPELSNALVFDIYASSNPNVFYLATENGLWKRTSAGEFERQ